MTEQFPEKLTAEEFNTAVARLNDQANDLTTNIADVTEKVRSFTGKYQRALELEVINNEKVPQKEAFAKKLREYKEELVELTAKLNILTVSREQILRDKLPGVRSWRNDTVQAKQREYNTQVTEALKAKKAYLEAVAKLGAIKKEAEAVHSSFVHCKSIAEPGSKHEYLGWHDALMFDRGWSDGKEPIGVSERDIIIAHNNLKVNVQIKEG